MNYFQVNDSIIYNSDSLYPNNPIEIVRNGIFDGARLVTIAVYPLQYRPKSRRLFINQSISFEFQFCSTNIPERPRIRGINAQKVYNRILSSVIGNNNDIPLYYQPLTLIPDAPPPIPTPATYTIIANDTILGMMEEFQPLAD
ncbi:MAG: C25 family peptidase propeptide domain-containing protein [candidate division WOR-3 bacterium]